MACGYVRDLKLDDDYFLVGRWRSLESHSLGMGGGAGRCQKSEISASREFESRPVHLGPVV